MGRITGDLAVLSLTDIIQFAGLYGLTGTITVQQSAIEKRIYVREGLIFFVSSNKAGERLGEYLNKTARIDMERINAALSEAQRMRVPFTQRLIKMQYVSPAGLKNATAENARQIILDAVLWHDGSFVFDQSELPVEVLDGPIRLDSYPVMQEIYRQLDREGAGVYRRNISLFLLQRQTA